MRNELVDALRALALFGILQVNIQSYVWGAGDPLGYFAAPPGTLDTALYLLVATFVSGKFMSLFAMLFGFGFALQWRRLKRRAGRLGPNARASASRAYRRRLWFLLGVGVTHGTLLYYGDILTAYAVTGFVVLAYADVRPAVLLRATALWWMVAVLWTVIWILFADLAPSFEADADVSQVPEGNLKNFVTYSTAGFIEQIGTRVADYFAVLVSSLFGSLPQLIGLFLLGALAGRLGWLQHPGRHPRVWLGALAVGIAALPVAALGAWVNYRSAVASPSAPLYFGYALQMIGSTVVLLYLALAVRFAATPLGARALRWVAPVGRMPLTNYLLQSLLLGALLSGWGLGLGAFLSRAQLAVLAVLIVIAQWIASRIWLGHLRQGPVEILWRRATYR